MWILALDTSTREGSAALARDGEVVAVAKGDPARTHGERLPGDLQALVAQAGVTLSDIDLFAVSSGPGAFTGLRVGLASIQALALVHRRGVVQVSTLDALARTPGSGELVLAWSDAHRRDVFAALYERAGAVRLAGPRVGQPVEILESWTAVVAGRRVDVVGDGVPATRALLARHFGPAAVLVDDPPPLAPVIARVAFECRDRAIAPHAAQPLYVRRPDAVIAREGRS
jgi:tRNA threonylcarbamoyladenosine biosynthesis protein TsaB